MLKVTLSLPKQSLALSAMAAVSGKGRVGPSPILLCSWGCCSGKATPGRQSLHPGCPCFGSLIQPHIDSASSPRTGGQSGWCWRSPLLKKWKRKWTKLLSVCPLVPHWLNPGCQKTAQEKSHFKKQLREIKPSYPVILDSGPPLLPCPTQTHSVHLPITGFYWIHQL